MVNNHNKAIIEVITYKLISANTKTFVVRILTRPVCLLVGAHGPRSGHLVQFLVALSFSKFQTFPKNNPEGNPLKSVYLTPKIAFTFRPMWSLNGRVAYISLSINV